ncbi:STAS domain-containing protein [candidate division KSB1 bacterium]|nr:STAS domain-containing protein [candidate division KSB1 bacterium]
MSVEIRTVQRGSMVLVEVCGEVDLYTSPQLRAEILKMAAGKNLSLMVNLECVTYMDSSGVATLVEALQHVNRNGGRMVLFGLQAEVKEIFELTRLDKVFDIRSNFETAMKWVTA